MSASPKDSNRGYRIVLLAGLLLALVVIVLGAYTRLADAGLGCPDWPGCYGKILVPGHESEVEHKHYLEQRPLEPDKGWKEMIHRYAAGTLGLVILGIAIWSWFGRERHNRPVWLPTFLVAVVIFQAVLGMWTVTWQLKPVVVMGHLLGGFATLSLLALLLFISGGYPGVLARQRASGLRPWALLALLVLVAQIALGGWTSSNYAALACPDFPACQGVWWPETDFGEAFVLWRGLGVNYEFGVLEHPARTAIHLTHRIGAIVTLLVVGALALSAIRRGEEGIGRTGWLMALLLLAQIGLGIANVVLSLPLPVAVAHNAVAALLLLSIVYLNFQLWPRRY